MEVAVKEVSISARVTIRHAWPGVVSPLIIAFVSAVLGLLALASPSFAEVSDVPDDTAQTNGMVLSVLPVGDRIYIGGDFTEVDGAPRDNLAAIDTSTGQLVAGWDPNVNGRVFTLAASPDGSRIYVGGAFTQVGGVSRNRAASLITATGALDTQWKAGASHTVRALAASGNEVYMGGDFVTINGQSRDYLAKVDATTGDPDPNWTPSANNDVRQLDFSPDGSRLYAGGNFTSISGQSRNRLAALAPTTGALSSWRPTVNPNGTVIAMTASGSLIYTAEGGPGGAAAAYDATTGNRAWRLGGDGNGQAIAVMDGKAYIGGHFINFSGQRSPFFAAANATTGVLDSTWTPSGGGGKLTDNFTTGVWTYVPDTLRGRLYTGTNFAQVSGRTQRGFVQFSDPTVPPPQDTTAPAVNAVSPTDAEQDVGASADVEALFSEAMNPATINTMSFTLTKQGGNVPVPATVSYDGISDKATLNPDADLEAGQAYTARITTGAKDTAGNALAQEKVWAFTTAPPADAQAPETTIDSGPSRTVNVNDASFVFSSTETGSTFECALDNGAFSPCSAPKDYVALSDGPHTFQVRATDSAGNTDATPASRDWTINTDTTPPETTIDSGPSGTTNVNDASFVFSSPETGSTFECALDGEPFTVCSSPKDYASLSDGSHTFQVRATDAADNTDATPAERTWTVSSANSAPAVEAPEESLINLSRLGASYIFVMLDFSATDPDGISSYQLQQSRNGGPYTDVSLPSNTATNVKLKLSPGNTYQYRLRATDSVGNMSDWVAANSFAVEDYQEANPLIAYTGIWSQQAVSSAYGRALKFADGRVSERASITFTGSEIAWVAPKGPDRGRADIYLDGVKVDTVDLYSSTSKPRLAAFADSVGPGVHTLEVRALGTKRSASSGTRIDVDAFFVLR